MLVRITNSSGGTEQEFLVKQSVESARCGRKGIVFHLEVETMLMTFKDEETAKKFTQMVDSIR